MKESLETLLAKIPMGVELIAVSKNHSPEEIMDVYEQGIRDFGENKVQELIVKQPLLPPDIRWHLIGHLQTNKVKYIAPFVHLIQSVDSLKLLLEIDKQAKKNNRIIDCLLQVYIAEEETKYGLDFTEATQLLEQSVALRNVKIRGLMGMATFTDNIDQITHEFRNLKSFFERVREQYFDDEPSFSILSMGMSGDYEIALKEGSSMIRIGTAIFGERNYKKM